MQVELDREAEWQLRNAKLAEISSMARSMYALMSRPLKSTSDIRLRLVHDLPSEDNDALDMMQVEIDELIRISQSFAWMYRAFQSQGDYSASSDQLIAQLQILLRLKFDESGWKWKSNSMEALEITGPIPSIMVLLYSIIILIVENYKKQYRKRMQIGLNRIDSLVSWTLSWPVESERVENILKVDFQDDITLNGLRRDLVKDLLQASGAVIQEDVLEGFRILQVTGPWGKDRAASAHAD